MPRVSVILPAYNAAATLPAAIASVLGQGLDDLEVIVADDGSHDGTAEKAAAIARRDGRVRVLPAMQNGGAAAARNRAIAAARGDWLALLDADDRMAPGRLARLLALGEAERAEVVADNLRLVADDGTGLGTALRPTDPLFAGPLTAATFVRRNLFLIGGFKLGYLKPLIRRDFIERHGLRQDEDLRIAEDFHFLLDCLLAGAHCVIEPEAGYLYRQRPDSLSRGLGLDDLHRLAAANRAVLIRPEAGGDRALSRALRRRQWSADLNVDFQRFVEAVKGRRMFAAGAIFARHLILTPFLAYYGLESLRKRLPGGRRLV